jgi:hypothetical protein
MPQHLRVSTEDEMVAAFLGQELASERFGAPLAACMARLGLRPEQVSSPDLSDAVQNALRRAALRAHRGYATPAGGEQYLVGFPAEAVRWDWMALAPVELLDVRYIRYDYWLALSGGSRRPLDAAANICAAVRPFGVSNAGFLAAADQLRAGATFPPLILVTAGSPRELVVLEGHLRLTAYALAREAIPPQVHALVGQSPAVAAWDLY